MSGQQKNNKAIDLIQPRHNYAAPLEVQQYGHLFMPTSLLTVAARLLGAGVEVHFTDENFERHTPQSNIIGLNLLGPPYIPEAIKIIQTLESEIGRGGIYLLGGQPISGLLPHQFSQLFGAHAKNGNVDSVLEELFSLSPGQIPEREDVSLIPAYELLGEKLKLYLEREGSIYLSDGCKFSCKFCSVANRTKADPITGSIHKGGEVYRDVSIFKKDLGYLVKKAKEFGLQKLSFYLSNLDLFQSPEKLLEAAYAIQEVSRAEQFPVFVRGLSCASSFLQAREKNQESIDEMIKAGLTHVGFGIDGWGDELWKSLRKGHNRENDCIEAIRSLKEDFGVTPEILMVFGHPGMDSKETFQNALLVTKEMVEKYGVIPRPHVAKAFIPGNDGWNDLKNAKAVNALLKNPELFQALDFTALPSSLTHPKEMIPLVMEHYLLMCTLRGNTTQPIIPLEQGMGENEIARIKALNEGKFDR
ncbi:hypothetical protein HYU14_06235 [Candidatus Woesearchaeota archaeon]|nr:hypothetical protein [Candidatus Woesearchaeota archaeon]